MPCAYEYHTLEGTSTHAHLQPLTMPLVWPSNSLSRNFLEISIICLLQVVHKKSVWELREVLSW